jgi:hypothetical protein
MRQLRKVGSALVLAGFVATGMFASSAQLQAAGPGGGNSQEVHCRLLQRAIDTAIALGADADLIAFLQAQYDAQGCSAVAQ